MDNVSWTSRWSGRLLVGFTAVAAAAMLAAAPAVAAPKAPTPAATTHSSVSPLTNRVDCSARTDFLELIKLSGETLCFANQGDLDVTVFDVDHLESGNNAGSVTFIGSNGSTFTNGFAKFNSVHIGGTVKHIHIV